MKSIGIKNRRTGWLVKLLIWAIPTLLLLFFTVVVSVSLGSANLSLTVVWQIIISHAFPFLDIEKSWPDTADIIVWQIRMPRVFLAIIVGAALSAAGVTYQGILRNPLADPYILGVSSGASFGAALVIFFGLQTTLFGQWTLPIVAFVSGVITLLVVYRLALVGKKLQIGTLILSGVILQAFLGAGLSLLLAKSEEKMGQIMFWLMGSLSLSDWSSGLIIAPYVFIGILIIYLFSREMNILSLGEQNAQHLGVNVKVIRIVLLLTASLIAGAAVAVSGIIGFVGLVVPHIMRSLCGTDHRILLPLSALAGSILLIGADTLARTIMQPSELPIGVITALLGAPFFAYLLRKRKKEFF